MALHDPSPKLNYDDYVRLPDDGKRHEIIDGEHFVTAAPFVRHQKLVVRFTLWLGGLIEARRLGHLLVAPTDVVLSSHDVVQPDLLFISRERASIIKERNVQGAPDLVIEILSETTRHLDTLVKRKLYERFGVREYWMVDPHRKTVETWEQAPGGLRRKTVLSATAGDSLMTPLCLGWRSSWMEFLLCSTLSMTGER